MMLSRVCSDTLRHLSVLLLLIASHQASAQAQCYLPNGSVATGDLPCASSPDATDCCPSDYQCLPFTQLCYKADATNSNQLLFARGSCTDKNWGPGCPGFCASGNLSSTPLVAMNRCASNPDDYCCVEGSATSCDCTSDNTVNAVGSSTTSASAVSSPTPTPSSSTPTSSAPSSTQSSVTASAQAESSSTPSPSSASTPLPSAGSHLTLAEKIGVGVAVSIGTVAVTVVGIIYMLYKMKKEPNDDDDENLNDVQSLPDPPSTTHSTNGGSLNGRKAVSPAYFVGSSNGMGMEDHSVPIRPISEASSQYTTDIPYASSTTFAPTNHSADQAFTASHGQGHGQWPLTSMTQYYPSIPAPARTRSPDFRSSYEIMGSHLGNANGYGHGDGYPNEI